MQPAAIALDIAVGHETGAELQKRLLRTVLWPVGMMSIDQLKSDMPAQGEESSSLNLKVGSEKDSGSRQLTVTPAKRSP